MLQLKATSFAPFSSLYKLQYPQNFSDSCEIPIGGSSQIFRMISFKEPKIYPNNTSKMIEFRQITRVLDLLLLPNTVYEKEPYEENICFKKNIYFFKKHILYILLKKTYILFQKTYVFWNVYVCGKTYIFRKAPSRTRHVREGALRKIYVFPQIYTFQKTYVFLKKYICFKKKYICFLKKYIFF